MDGKQSSTRTPPVTGPAAAPDGGTPRQPLRTVLLQLVVFAAVGGAFNVFYGVLYLALRTGLDAQPANAVALVLSTLAGTWGHRRVTFGVRVRTATAAHQTLGLLLLGFGLAVTAGSLWVLEAVLEQPSRAAELAVLVAANLGVGLVRFAAFRTVMLPLSSRRGPAGDARQPA